jgi:S1-C subfamily serine protease
MQDMRFIRPYVVGFAALLAIAPVARAQNQAPKEAPKGWLGVLITTGIGQSNEAGALVFNDYPVIESIDPGSPAERAGLQAGDILLSINKQDFRKNPIPLNSLLVPGKKVVFRYRRDNIAKMSTLTVATRPAGTSARVQLSLIGPDPRLNRESVEGMARRVVTRVPLPPAVTVAPMVFGTGTPSIGIAGAELTQLNEGLRDFANLKGDGIFVINVTLGSPAGESGLRPGDLIVRADKELVQNPGQLIRLMMKAEDNSLILQILRKQKEQNLTLRW